MHSLIKRHKLIVSLISVNIFVGTLYIGNNIKDKLAKAQAEDRMIHETAKTFAQAGVLPEERYIKITDIGKTTRRTGNISDEDLIFCLSVLERRFKSREDYNKTYPEKMMVGSRLTFNLKHITSTQQDMLYSSFKNALKVQKSSRPPSTCLTVTAALLSQHKDERIASDLLQMLQMSNKSLQTLAKESLQRLGRTIHTSTS